MVNVARFFTYNIYCIIFVRYIRFTKLGPAWAPTDSRVFLNIPHHCWPYHNHEAEGSVRCNLHKLQVFISESITSGAAQFPFQPWGREDLGQFFLLEESLDFHNIMDKLSFTKQNLGTKNKIKCCHVGILEGDVLWPLASSVKVEHTNFCSPLITLLEPFVYSTNGHSMKYP
jgi:hypothetical protein